MLSRHLYAVLLAFLLQPGVEADQQGSLPFLSSNGGRNPKEKTQDVLEHKPATAASCEHFPTGPIETTSCDFESVEAVSNELYSDLQDLVKTPFFKYYRADLYRDCPFWQENGLCENRECGITTVDESEIPEGWRTAALSKVEITSEDDLHYLPGCYYRDADFCFLDDTSEGEYVDLTLNPERFTGYSGPSANRIWSSIYQENCFKPPAELSLSVEQQCLEERVYYKIISGLHASISTHICFENFDQTTGTWGPNLPCFISRIASHPERLENIYFNTILLLRAVSRIGDYLSAYDYCGMKTGSHEGEADAFTLEKLNNVVKVAREVGRFDEKSLFQGEDALNLKEEFKQHFRNVSRIMDCVGCDKCRLWGKLQTSGVGTALKILFELDPDTLDPTINHSLLSRSEVVALVNTLNRFTESLVAVNTFRKMWAEKDHGSQGELLESTVDGAQKPQYSPVGGKELPHDLVTGLQRWMQACKDGTALCVRGLVQAVNSLLELISSFFKLSGKQNVPMPHHEF